MPKSEPRDWIPALIFHPTLALLATAGSPPDTPEEERCREIHIYELDYDVLLGSDKGANSATNVTSTKIVVQELAVAELRTRFEEVIFELSRLAQTEKLTAPTCFVSYAWGNPEHERWVEHRLAMDLEKAGIKVILDRWENLPGADIQRFVDRIEKADRVLIVGTKAYRRKYENKDPSTGTVVALEMKIVWARLTGPADGHSAVIPLLLEIGRASCRERVCT